MSEPGFRQDHLGNGGTACSLDTFLKKATMSTSPFHTVRVSCYPQEIKRANSHYLPRNWDISGN